MRNDINQDTGDPYVPEHVLHAALWAASDLQTRITSYRPDGTLVVAPTPAPGSSGTKNRKRSGSASYGNVGMGRNASGAESSQRDPTSAGLSFTTAEIMDNIENVNRNLTARNRRRNGTLSPGFGRMVSGRNSPALEYADESFGGAGIRSASPMGQSFFGNTFNSPADRSYWPIPIDNTVRIGDAVSQAIAFQPYQPLPDLGPAFPGMDVKPSNDIKPAIQGFNSGGEANFFGFGPSARTGREIQNTYEMGSTKPEAKGDGMWSRYEPFRFSVEFWNVEKLREKDRAYSKTVFHAGEY